jgi:hypothetical protein
VSSSRRLLIRLPLSLLSAGAAPTSLYRLSDTFSVAAATKESYHVWDLPNGRVEFHNPFIFDGFALHRSSSSGQQMILESDHTSSSVRSETSSIALWDPIFLGR